MIINAVIDRLPRIRELAASGYANAVRRGVRHLLPRLGEAQCEAVVRGALRHRAFNRAVQRFHTRFPRVALAVARAIPTTIPHDVAALIRGDRPIVLAAPHIGPVFFVLTVVLGALHGRPVYCLHSSRTQCSNQNARYLQRLGVTSVLHDEEALRTLMRALRTEPRCVAIICFDHLEDGNRPIELFETRLAVSYGVAFLAEIAQAPVVTACWQFTARWPRVCFAGPYTINPVLARDERRAELMRRLYGALEREIRKAPQQWTEWQFAADAAVRGRALSR